MRLPNKPCVSVLMPCLNAAGTVAAAVKSIRRQTFQNWELLVADDGSNDQSRAIVRDLSLHDKRVKLLECQGPPKGAAVARNRALDQANGRYIAFLDADDLWLPTKLENQLALMRSRQSAFSCTSYIVRRAKRGDYLRCAPATMTRQTLLRGNRVGCLTAIYDTKALGKQPMPEISRRHDYALWLHLLSLVPCAVGLSEPLAIHHRQPGSLSANPWTGTRATFEMLQNQAGLSRTGALKATAHHVTGRLLRG